MSVVGVGITVGTIVLLVVLAVVVNRDNATSLIAQSQPVDLPPEQEAKLARDVRNTLLVASVAVVPLLVHFMGRELPAVIHTGIPSVVPLVLVAWLFWKWEF